MKQNKQSGFTITFILAGIIVVLVISAALYLLLWRAPKSQSTNLVISPTLESKAEASQYPKTAVALTQQVYQIYLSSIHNSPQTGNPLTYALSQVKSYLSPDLYNTLLNQVNNGYGGRNFVCLNDYFNDTFTVSPVSSAGNTATVNVHVVFKPPLPHPDPSAIDIQVLTSLDPLKITAVNCPSIPYQPAG